LQRGQLEQSGWVDRSSQDLQAEVSRLNKELRSLDERNNFLNQRIDNLTKIVEESNNSVNSRLEKFKAALLDLISKKSS
jgi:peptidoglycan hydrolase CwlO-like protein